MNNNPLISVIIPTYNSAAFIGEAIESVLAQTYKNIEIIVIDDGSKDNTADVVRPFGDRIQYIQKENGGPASARNVGIKESKGELLAFLDSDDIWLPTKLEKQMKVMRENPSMGLVACSEYEMDTNRIFIGKVIHANYSNYERFKRRMVISNGIGGGSTALIYRRCIDKLGLFDENLHGTEDWDMWLRIALHYEVRFVEEPLIQARVREDSISSPVNAEKMLQNEIKVLDKLFADKQYQFPSSLQKQSYAQRYFTAGKTLKNSGRMKEALPYLLKAVKISPAILLNSEFWKVLVVVLVRGK